MVVREFVIDVQYREDLTEQKALADEIGTAIANGPQTGEPIDEAELDEELANLEQEDLDEKMLKTGTVPVLPNAANGESEFIPSCAVGLRGDRRRDTKYLRDIFANVSIVKGKSKVTPEEEDEEEELRKLQAEMAM